MFFKQFGGKVTKQLIEQYSQSPNWSDGRFHNLEKTELDIPFSKMPSVIYKQLAQGKEKEPKPPLFVQPFDKTKFLTPSPKSKIIWYGHSAILMRINKKNILIDPMLGPDTSPIAPITTKRFSDNTLTFIDEFPNIDLIVLTHDHYDHLDYASIQKLKGKTKKYWVALGLKRHLVSWGVDRDSITEFDWWDSKILEDITITFTPTRHFSGRGLTDRQQCLWGGWAFKTDTENIWFSGDGGYGNHFKMVGERLGPFDFGFMESGQYNDDWHQIHLFPHESIQAAIDANVKKVMPVHWAGFALSYQHTWQEPVEDFIKAARDNDIEFAIPKLGSIFNLDTEKKEEWWLH